MLNHVVFFSLFSRMLRLLIILHFAALISGKEIPLQVDVTKAVKCPDEEKAAKSDKVRIQSLFWRSKVVKTCFQNESKFITEDHFCKTYEHYNSLIKIQIKY